MQLSGCEVKRIAQSQELKRLLKEKSGKKCLTGKDEGAKLRKPFGRDSRRKTSSQFPVMMAKGYHLFPYRTQKLSPSAPMVLGWTRPGRVGRCRNPIFLSSSMAEHSAVNRVVVGSSPTWGAIPPQSSRRVFVLYSYYVPAMLLENGKNGGDACLYCLEECSRLRCWRAFSLEHVLQDTVHYPLRR